MILSDDEITKAIGRGDIVIDPFNLDCLGPNSYDVHLGRTLATYRFDPLDAALENEVEYFDIPDKGLLLAPGVLCLASTQEYTETRGVVPYLDGKSSVGRLGIQVHLTAGRGDVGFKGYWTLELSVVQNIKVYAGMPIAQITYHTVHGAILRPYDKNPTSKYNNRDPKPMASAMWKNFSPKCEVCKRPIREGLRFCPGLSACWRTGTEKEGCR